jgi:hypothetical protein
LIQDNAAPGWNCEVGKVTDSRRLPWQFDQKRRMDSPRGGDYVPAEPQDRGMNYQRFFEEAIDQLHAERRYRVFADIERIVGSFPRAIWRSGGEQKEITVWCSNDYLGMGQHPDVIAAMQDAAGRMGSGAGGTRNISGTNHPLVELEAELADLHGKEAGLVFTSGFVSNEAAISTIGRLLPNCLILSDELNHSSMIEGVRRSGADTWYRGRFIERWAQADVLEALGRTYAHYEQADVIRALFETMDLFRRLAKETARAAALPYPEHADRYATEWVGAQFDNHIVQGGDGP